ncbi:MAG: flagellar biosynthetic protein FliR [Spirochaetes bacterium]|nr:flagellar biosynthetic protein FliR [Spirochaetota bacterium]
MFDLTIKNFQLFLIILFRILAMVEVAPLLSSSLIPQLAKVGLSFFTAVVVYPWVVQMGYQIPDNAVQYFMLVIGEVLIGIIIGFFLTLIYAAFLVAGQFFSLQMGFGASQVYDPLAQIQIPLMGQFLNLIAMLVFLSINGFQKFMLVGVMRSFQTIKAIDLVTGRDYLVQLFIRSLGKLFANALTIAFPVLGTLLLISISMGLLAKAAPQMNLLMMGFPIAIGVGFLILFLTIPFLVSAFERIIDMSFNSLARLYLHIGGGS